MSKQETDWKLIASSSWLSGQEFPIFEDSTILGRAKDCDIVIPGTHLSRRHAEITVTDDDKLLVRDLKSVNGTFLNNHPINGESFATSGDEIRIDVFSFKVVGPGGVVEAHTEVRTPTVHESAHKTLDTIRSMRHSEEKDYTDTQWVTKPTSVGNRTHNVPSGHGGPDVAFWIALGLGVTVIAGLVFYFLA
jgi:pSer/pThr/pTyr-binding forkhead associated (FHA) protein